MAGDRALELSFWLQRDPGLDLHVEGATVAEGLDEPYRLSVDLRPEDDAMLPEDWIEEAVELRVRRSERVERCLGVVVEAREHTEDDGTLRISLQVAPALSLLALRRDSRIFQQQTVPEILQTVLSEALAPFGRAVQLELTGHYPPREYTLQYAESDYDFALRLMEEEGITFGFEHEGDAELLVLRDRNADHPALQERHGDELSFVPDSGSERSDATVTHFELGAERTSSQVTVRTFDWTHPATPIEAGAPIERSVDRSEAPLEEYRWDETVTYSGFGHAYTEHNSPDQLRIAVERQRRRSRSAQLSTTALGARAGRRFTLADHPVADANVEYLIERSEQRYWTHAGGTGRDLEHEARARCIPSAHPHRPLRLRRRTPIHGVQTATVVGPPGEEIHPDVHGRVKVRFHWDRRASGDEHDSCWIRVMQAMGGPGWGYSFVPRIGMEVVVSFVEGDPDRPLITGVVYNPQNPPPYDYPAEKTKLTIKSVSSPGSGGFNELRFEDRAGEEEVYLHAEKDWNSLVLNDLGREVRRDEKQAVDRDRKRTVERDEAIEVKRDRNKDVAADEQATVGQDRSREVGGDETITIGASREKTVGQNETVEIGGSAYKSVSLTGTQVVGASSTATIGKSAQTVVAQSQSFSVGTSKALDVVGNVVQQSGGNLQQTIANTFTRKVRGLVNQRIKGAFNRFVARAEMTTITGLREIQVDPTRVPEVATAVFKAAADRYAKARGNLDAYPVYDELSAASRTETSLTTANHHSDFWVTKVTASNTTTVTSGKRSVVANQKQFYLITEEGTFSVGDTKVTVTKDAVTVSSAGDLWVQGDTVSLESQGTIAITSGGDTDVEGLPVALNCG